MTVAFFLMHEVRTDANSDFKVDTITTGGTNRRLSPHSGGIPPIKTQRGFIKKSKSFQLQGIVNAWPALTTSS